MQGPCSCAVPTIVGHHHGCTSTTAWLPDGNQRSGYVQLIISFMTLWWYNKIWIILVQVATERVTVGLFIHFVVGYLLWSLLLLEPSVTFATCCCLFSKKKKNITPYFLSTFSFCDQLVLLHFCLFMSASQHYLPFSSSVFPPSVCLQSNPPFRPTHPACPHGFPRMHTYPLHGPGLSPKPSHGTTSAPTKQQVLKTKMDIWQDTLRKRRCTPRRPPPTGTAH